MSQITFMQKKSVDDIRLSYERNLAEYIGFGSDDVCSFKVLRNEKNDKDDNIVVSVNQVASIDENNYPLTENIQVLIEPNGNVIPLNQIIPNQQQRIKYFKSLTAIEI